MRVTQREMEAPDRGGRSRVKTEAEQAGMCRESPEAPGAGGGREGIPGAGRTAVLCWLLDLGLLASELREETATAVGHHVCGASSPPPQDTRTKEASGPDPSPPVTAASANQQEEGGPAAASRPRLVPRECGRSFSPGIPPLSTRISASSRRQKARQDKGPAGSLWHQITVTLVNHQESP